MTVDEILSLVRAGGGVVVDACTTNQGERIQIAQAAKASKAPVAVILKRASECMQTDEMLAVARAGGGKIVFDLV